MALNPVVYTEKVVRYQLTAYPFADERLHRQMRGPARWGTAAAS